MWDIEQTTLLKVTALSFHTSHVFRLLSLFAVSFSSYLFAIRVLLRPNYPCIPVL